MTGPARPDQQPAEQPDPGTPVVPGTDTPADPTTGQPTGPGPEDEPADDGQDGEDE